MKMYQEKKIDKEILRNKELTKWNFKLVLFFSPSPSTTQLYSKSLMPRTWRDSIFSFFCIFGEHVLIGLKKELEGFFSYKTVM